jgi:hypothetical protein
MNCRFCGSALPAGALFCGECGRPAGAVPAPQPVPTAEAAVPSTSSFVVSAIASGTGSVGVAPEESPVSAEAETEPEPPLSSPGPQSEPAAESSFDGVPARAPRPVPMELPDAADAEAEALVEPAPAGRHSSAVATTSTPADGVDAPRVPDAPRESGAGVDPAPEPAEPFVAPAVAPPGSSDPRPAPLVEPGSAGSVAPAAPARADPTASAPPEPAPIPPAAVSSSSVPAAATPPAAAQTSSVPDASRPMPAAEPLLPVPDIPVARPQFAPGLPQLPDGQREVAIDLEDTRLVSRTPRPASWVLQFSTGESFTVSGSGLIGRNPSAQPAEFMDQLVPLFDAGKSVSKTHLEFGQDSGRFWVSDRYSTNGTVIRPPDSEPRRCEPGRRYLVSRGTRVDIGDQFFVVS